MKNKKRKDSETFQKKKHYHLETSVYNCKERNAELEAELEAELASLQVIIKDSIKYIKGLQDKIANF